MLPSYIVNSSTTNGDNSCSTVNPQRMSTTFPYYNHETLNLNTSDHMQFAMEKNLSYNNGGFVAAENNCLKRNCLKGKRSSNKDRHSKINTARGPKDRRMRLSVAVAKKFFRLQDLLGFDKASTTIEWLLMKSKPAIRDLGHQHLDQNCSVMLNGPCSGLECEDKSMEQSRNDQTIIPADVQERLNYCNSNCIEKRRVDQCLAKETREKARERARKRTSEKRNVIVDENTSKLGTWIPFGESQVDELGDQAEYPSSDSHLKQGFDGDNSSIMSNSWSPSFLFNYQHTFGPSHEHEFSDFQLVGKQWEGINN